MKPKLKKTNSLVIKEYQRQIAESDKSCRVALDWLLEKINKITELEAQNKDLQAEIAAQQLNTSPIVIQALQDLRDKKITFSELNDILLNEAKELKNNSQSVWIARHNNNILQVFSVKPKTDNKGISYYCDGLDKLIFSDTNCQHLQFVERKQCKHFKLVEVVNE